MTTTTTTTYLHNKTMNEATGITFSHYSSSRGSTNSFLHDNKKIDGDDRDDQGGKDRLMIVDHRHDDCEKDEDEDEEDYWDYGSGKKGFWWRYFSFKRSNSCGWVSIQIGWRFLLSLLVSLLVFYSATKPPPPHISLKIARVRPFGLSEGVDQTGVTTKILSFNCTLNLIIDNKSKLFGLHIRPSIIQMSFGRLPFLSSRGPNLYAGSYDTSIFKLFVGIKSKPMYGARSKMQDMLESSTGLPILIGIKVRSNYRVVWDLIKSKFHHEIECLLVLHSKFDKKHRTQSYNSTCSVAS